MSNTSASGGYLTDTSSPFDLVMFLQRMLTQISGYPGSLVRPAFQGEAPKQPEINFDWLAFTITGSTPDANGYSSVTNTVYKMGRTEQLEISMWVYGPNAFTNARAIRDAFEISQNLDGLRAAKLGFVGTSVLRRVPELINERWRDRYDFTLVLNSETLREYPILSFASATGVVHTGLAAPNDSANINVTGP